MWQPNKPVTEEEQAAARKEEEEWVAAKIAQQTQSTEGESV
jgi:hypothetical protein